MAKREIPGTRYVYFIEALGLRRVKIGLANHPESRVRELQTASPAELRLAATVATNNARSCEGWLHRRFDHLRVVGEWFRIDAEMRRLMKTLGCWPLTAKFEPDASPLDRPTLFTPAIVGRGDHEMCGVAWRAGNILYWQDTNYGNNGRMIIGGTPT